MNAVLVGRYAWLSEPWPSGLGEAGCVTVASPASRDAVLDAFAAEVDERVAVIEASLGAVAHVAVAETDGAVVAYELNGFEGSRAEVLERASRQGKAANIFWNVNGQVTFACARRGRVVCWVDLLLDDDPSELPSRLRKLLPDDRFEADLVAVGVAMVEVFTGVAVVPDMLSARELAYVVHPRLNSLDTETVEDCGLGYEHPALVRQLAAAPGATGHAVAEWSAVQALRQVGLLDDDAVQTVIGQFGGGSVAQVTSQFMQRAAQLGRDRDRTRARLAAVQNGDPHAPYWVEELEFHWANQRIWAIQATRYACVEDGVSAALGAVDTGMRCFGCVGADSAFAAQAGQLIGTPLAEWPEQPTALPAPLTAEQRAEQLDWAAWRPRYGDDVRVPALEPWQRGHQRLRELIRDFSLGGLEPDMIDLERLPVMTRRAIAVWAAHRALEQAGLDRLSWITPALAALDDGRSLPPPFDDPADAWARLAADAEAPSSYVTAFDGETQDHQQSMALPVLAVAALADATQAATNALWYAAATAGIDYNTQVVQPLHQVFDL